VKDEFLKGWALEAGTLVLANKGMAVIDEMDKMSEEDTSAMHEALEQQSVSISKANIQATLRCETTVLAAANPKFGRFDPYELIAKQINMPEPLINRFDLIFPIKDLPDPTKDEQMATFILNLHRGNKAVKDETLLDTVMIRKYIAFAKQNCFPELTDDALDEIKQYYVQMRNQGGESSAVPISARQLEALVRLAEASAKARLSDKVTRSDAKRSIELTHYCLSQIGVDPETGKFDIDRITTGVTAAQRSNISLVKEVINDLEKAIGKMIPVDDVVREAEIKGIAQDKTTEIVEKLKRSGDLFSPKNGFISRI
jgi:replicative DNA helicase Mcm